MGMHVESLNLVIGKTDLGEYQLTSKNLAVQKGLHAFIF